MAFDPSVTLGNLLTVAAMVLTALGAVIAINRWQVRTEARIESLEKDKLDRSEYVEKHGAVVTTGFCNAQHEKTNTCLEKLSEEFGDLGITVQRLLTNQEWVMRQMSTIYENNHRHANPDMPPLEPFPTFDEQGRKEG